MLAWCWLGGALGWLGAGFGVAVACVVIPCLRSYACWAGLGSVGGIATIGAALRRVVGVSGVYGRKTPRVVGRKGQRRVLFRWLCWSCSACLRVFVVVVWLVFVGGLGGIATIGAALRRVVGVSGVYGRKTPRVVAWKGQGRVLFRWLCWLCSACLRLFVGVVWLVFVGGLGGIATIGAALRRVVGVSGVYGRKTPRVLGRKGQRRVPVEGSMVAKPPSACSKCSRPRWNGGDMGFLGCSGRRFGRAGSWRGVFCGAACRVRRASVRAAGMIELTVGA